MKLVKVSDCCYELPRDQAMKVTARVYTDPSLPVEDSALQQLRDAACLPVTCDVLATPDIHHGFGVPIGCVLALDNAILPAAVGYDINCGMQLLRTDFQARQVNIEQLARLLAKNIPLGQGKTNINVTCDQLDAILTHGLSALADMASHDPQPFWQGFDFDQWRRDVAATERAGSLPGNPDAVPQAARDKGGNQLGTLGGGNHFVELQEVETVYDESLARRFDLEKGALTVMIHSGSRRFGYEVADDYMRRAAQAHADQHNCPLPYISQNEPLFSEYLGAMAAAGNFAYVNRQMMTLAIRRCFREMFSPDTTLPLIYDVSHNMAQQEEHHQRYVWVHRKGATRAFGPRRMKGTPFDQVGQPIIIPGSMGTGSYLLVGRDESEQTLASVNHGAGRTMSRTAALGKRNKRGKVVRPPAITDDEFKRAMKGVTLIAAHQAKVKEEAPQAYKDIDAVIKVVTAAKLAHAVVRLRPLAVLKG